MSPAGDQLAYEQLDEVAGTRDIWTLDLARRQKTRITSDPDDDLAPAWSRDGRWIYFASNRGGRSAMYRHAADGTGGDEIVMPDSAGAVPFHVSSTQPADVHPPGPAARQRRLGGAARPRWTAG